MTRAAYGLRKTRSTGMIRLPRISWMLEYSTIMSMTGTRSGSRRSRAAITLS
jgi:hypothetical protein